MYRLLYMNLMVSINQKYIHTKKRKNPNITLKVVIKSQGKGVKEEEKNKKKLQNTHKKLTKWQ